MRTAAIVEHLFQNVNPEVVVPRSRDFDVDEAVDSAMRVFWTKGYAGASVEDLVTAMGINRSSMYHAFGDKDGLFAEVLRRYDREVVAEILREMEQGEGGLSAIRRYFSRIAEYHASKEGCRGCLMTNSATELAPHDPVSVEHVRAHLARLERAFAMALRRARERGEIANDASARDLARHLTAVTEGMQVMAKTCPSLEFLRSIVRTTLRTIPRPL